MNESMDKTREDIYAVEDFLKDYNVAQKQESLKRLWKKGLIPTGISIPSITTTALVAFEMRILQLQQRVEELEKDVLVWKNTTDNRNEVIVALRDSITSLESTVQRFKGAIENAGFIEYDVRGSYCRYCDCVPAKDHKPDCVVILAQAGERSESVLTPAPNTAKQNQT